MTTQKDVMIKFRSTQQGQNKKGGDHLGLYLDQEQVALLLETLTSFADNERGVKLDIHTSDKEYQGRSFKSSIAFVKPVQEFGGARGASKPNFVPKAKADTTAKIEALKAGRAKQVAA